MTNKEPDSLDSFDSLGSTPESAFPGTGAGCGAVALPEVDVQALFDSTPLEEPEAEALLTEQTGMGMWAVVFAGGIGSRFWPLSTPRRPKQVLPLVNERPLIADTVSRLSPLVPAERVLVVTSADIAGVLHEVIPHIPSGNMLVEPRPLGTAAALAWGAQEVARRAGPQTVFVALHADLAVGYPDVFRDSLRLAAASAASQPWMIALGATPTRPETGFGYLEPGDHLDGSANAQPDPDFPGEAHPPHSQPHSQGHEPVPSHHHAARKVQHFVEKPGAELASALIARGAFWNTGIFVWQAQTVLDELKRHTHELAHAMPFLEQGDMPSFTSLVTSVSIERGLLERSSRVAVLPSSFEWDDVGTWASLRRVRELDDTGNGVMGEVHCIDSSGNVIHADGNCVVAYGISGMVVVSIQGLTFVTTQERASELSPLLNSLPGSLRFNPGRHQT